MGFLAGKRLLITGVLSNRSIAYGVAHACRREGATLAFTYVNDELKDRVVKIAAEFGSVPVLPCDVTKDEDIDALFASLGREWGTLDGLLHAIAYAPREALTGDFLEATTRNAFAVAHEHLGRAVAVAAFETFAPTTNLRAVATAARVNNLVVLFPAFWASHEFVETLSAVLVTRAFRWVKRAFPSCRNSMRMSPW